MTSGDDDPRKLLRALAANDLHPLPGATGNLETAADPNASPYDGVFSRLVARCRELEARVAEETVRAHRDLVALLALPPGQRAARVRSSATGFRGPALAGLLLDASEREVAAAPRRAYGLAALAQEVLMTCRWSTYAAELLVRAVADCAHALTASGDFAGACHRIALLRSLAAVLGLDEPAAVEGGRLERPGDPQRGACEKADLMVGTVLAGLLVGAPFHPPRFL